MIVNIFIGNLITKALKEAGCEYIAYGVEAGSQRVMDSIRKGVTKEQVRKVFKLTQKIGIGINDCFIYGRFESGENLKELTTTHSGYTTGNPGILSYYNDPKVYFYYILVRGYAYPVVAESVADPEVIELVPLVQCGSRVDPARQLTPPTELLKHRELIR